MYNKSVAKRDQYTGKAIPVLHDSHFQLEQPIRASQRGSLTGRKERAITADESIEVLAQKVQNVSEA